MSFSNNHQHNIVLATFLSLLLILGCVIIGKSITTVPLVPLLAILALFMFFTAFTTSNLAMSIIIVSMLLSPELAIGAVSKQRNVVVRIDDLFILTFSMAWLARATINKDLRIITKTPLNFAIGLYMLSYVIPTAQGMLTAGVNPIKGIFYILKYNEYFAIYFLAAAILKDKEQIKGFLKVFLVTYAIVNIYAFTQIGSDRVSAPFEGQPGEPNTLGGYQVLMLGMIIGVLTHARSLKWRGPLIFLAAFSLVPFTFTLSRASYMAIIPMYLTLIVFSRGRMKNVLIALMIVAGIASIFTFPSNVKERIAYTFTAQDNDQTVVPVKIGRITLDPSASARINDWARLIDNWKHKPFLGYGLTGAGFVDSQFIGALVETGIFGFFAFIFLLWKLFYQTLRIYRNTKDDFLGGLAVGFLAGQVGMFFHAFTANTFTIIRIMEPYWFLAAIIMMIPKLEAQAAVKSAEEMPLDLKPNPYTTNTSFLLKSAKYRMS